MTGNVQDVEWAKKILLKFHKTNKKIRNGKIKLPVLKNKKDT